MVAGRSVDEITGMEHKIYIGGSRISLSDGSAPHRLQVVLGIAKIKERKPLRLFVGCFELKPFAVLNPIAHPVHIHFSGIQPGKIHAVIMRRVQIRLQQSGLGHHGIYAIREVGRRICQGNFPPGTLNIGTRAPANRLGMPGIRYPAQHNPIRTWGRRIGIRVLTGKS